MREDPTATPLFSPAVLHGAFFLFLSANALGNYVLVIQNSPDDLGACQGTSPQRPQCPPPSTHFCRVCSRVTLRHDHHCFFTGNCIGSRNMRNFILFCLYTSLACLYSMVAGVAYISAVLSISFAHPLAFLTLLPTSISQFFSGEWAVAGRFCKQDLLAQPQVFQIESTGCLAQSDRQLFGMIMPRYSRRHTKRIDCNLSATRMNQACSVSSDIPPSSTFLLYVTHKIMVYPSDTLLRPDTSLQSACYVLRRAGPQAYTHIPSGVLSKQPHPD